jgi:hypothetical protein
MLEQKRLLEDISVIGEYDQAQMLQKLAEIDPEYQQNLPSSPATFVNDMPKTSELQDFLETIPSKKSVQYLSEKSGSKGLDDILFKDLFNFAKKEPWSYTSHQLGYITPSDNNSNENLIIKNPASIKAHQNLKNKPINIRLDRLYIHDYPGSGTHNIMVTFVARNQLVGVQESVTFSQVYRVQGGNSAGIVGYPIFIGLNLGSQGLAFEFSTINVKNDEDEAVLQTIESDVFKNGLQLLTTSQPAIAPFTTMSLGLVKYLAKKNKNVPVQNLYLGLDFDDGGMGARLAEGSYIAVQVPKDNTIDWEQWVYQPTIGAIVKKDDNNTVLKYNYLVFRVTPYQD